MDVSCSMSLMSLIRICRTLHRIQTLRVSYWKYVDTAQPPVEIADQMVSRNIL